MNETTKLNPCAECASHCKPVVAALLIVLGVSMLKDVFLHRNNQK
jgi:hypothetical protein